VAAVESRDSASKPSAPPSLVFDHNLDSGSVLWQRLHRRSQDERGVRLIVHLKNGATYVGTLVYFDPTNLTISTRGRQYEFWVRDLAHVLAVPGALGFQPTYPD
jgi:hypothetical protein